MKINIFTIHDIKAHAYLPPFNLPTVEMAIRTFTDTVNDPKHSFYHNPADYTLFHIGTFDDNCAKISTLQTMAPLGNGLDFQRPITGLEYVTHSELRTILEDSNS